MPDIHAILKKYWGYDSFRSMQEEIIRCVLNGEDALALLPTGGGKSICFQVPAMASEGICLVVSPLIALMKDQVEQLRNRGIKAASLHTGMSHREIDITLDNCVYGDIKFLYVSPERLKTEIMQVRAAKMKINLLAIDEAHCISQWGYDFRPPYLEIGKFREILPDVPCLALTATATPKVQEDIIEKLDFRQKNQFQKSFARHNLSYSSFEVEDKFKKLLNILKGVPGSSVVYVRSRKRTKQIADFLVAKGISASFYHAGLENQERSKRQDAWIKGHTRVVVATNAFGMGIDKPDVRSVVHMDLPDNPEAYYQEAGRAGRDEHKAYAVLLYSPEDILLLRERTEASYPAIPTIKKVYQCLANYFRLAIGSGKFTTFDFDLDDFCKTYQLPRNQAYHSIKRLEDQGYLQMNEAFFAPSRLWVSASKDDLYSFTIAHSNYSSTIKILLRVYGGELFTHYQHISEYKIAQLLKRSPQEVKSKLKYMDEQNIVSYVPQQDQPQLLFLTERLPAESLPLAVKEMENRRMLAYTKAETMVNYASNQHRCRTGMLLDYFGEYYAKHCGVCDFCISQKKNSADIAQEQRIDYLIRQKLADNHCSLEQLMESLPPGNQQQIKDILRGMIDFKEIIRLPDGKLKLREQN